MPETTPKQRYEARRALRRAADDSPDWKRDEQLTQDYVLDLADRFVSAIEQHNAIYARKGV
jgi:hypothetical protein